VIVGVAGAVLLSLLWYFLLWSPQGKRLDAADERRTAAEQTNSQLQVTLDRLRDLESRRPELVDQLTELRRAVPDRPQLARLLLSAEDAAEQSGVELTTVTPGKPAADTTAAATTATTAAPTTGSSSGETTTTTTGDTAATTTPAATAAAPTAIPLSFNVKGGYFQILDFLNRVDDLPRIVVVDSLDLGAEEDAADPTGTASTDLNATITARMFTGATPTADATAGGAATPTPTTPPATTQTGTDS
jgi:Tfp pilus assembly protein PilO